MRRVWLAAAMGLMACGRGPVASERAQILGGFPNGNVGEPYRAELVVLPSSLTLPIVDVREGTLPPGLNVAVTPRGRIELSGTPLTEGRFDFGFDIRVTTPRVEDLRASFTVDVVREIPDEPLRITTETLPDAVLLELYEAQLEASGGARPYFFTLENGPPGLGVDATGLLRGLPQQLGVNTVQVRVTDDLGQSVPKQLSFEAASNDRPRILASLERGRVNRSYSTELRGEGSSGGPYQWRLVQGSFPPGLDLRLRRGTTAELTGLPRQAGQFSFLLELEDDLGVRGRTELELGIVGPLTVTGGTLPSARFAVPYRHPLDVQNPLAPVEARLVGGALPSGLQLVNEGEDRVALVGTTRIIGAYRFEFEIRDRLDSRRVSFTLRVTP